MHAYIVKKKQIFFIIQEIMRKILLEREYY